VGLTSGAVTGVIARAERIWGPPAAEWEVSLANSFTVAELTRITEFLQLTSEVGKRHLDRLAKES
jgi:hypothetical protein